MRIFLLPKRRITLASLQQRLQKAELSKCDETFFSLKVLS